MKRLVLAALAMALALPAWAQQSVSLDTFSPAFGAGVTVSATTTSANVALTAAPPTSTVIRVVNSGAVAVFCVWGTGAQTATATSMAIAAGGVFVGPLNKANNIACLASSTTASVYAIPGVLVSPSQQP